MSRPETVNYRRTCVWAGRHGPVGLVTGELQTVNLATAGVRKREGATTTFQPLIQTSADSMPIDTQSVQFMPDPKKLLSEFVPSGQRLTVAARITGKVKTAFPGGRPEAAPTPPKPGEEKKAEPKGPDPAFVAESAEPINVVVVTDCDMLTDRFWVQEERIGQMLLGYNKMADNGDLVIGALDNLSGSSDLISVRARASSVRPFDRIEKPQTDAEQTFLAKEQSCRPSCRRPRPRSTTCSGSGRRGRQRALLTPEQKTRSSSAERWTSAGSYATCSTSSGHRAGADAVKFANIGLMPILIGGAALGLSAWRVSRRKADRAAVKART
jgi:ABC-type uncharacterized transport system involved in gliding motility auxiliary subunit